MFVVYPLNSCQSQQEKQFVVRKVGGQVCNYYQLAEVFSFWAEGGFRVVNTEGKTVLAYACIIIHDYEI